MKIIISILTLLFIVLPVSASSVSDSFDAFVNSKTSGTSSVYGVGEFNNIANSKTANDIASGHGIEAGLKSIETHRAEVKAREARMAKRRMEEEARKNEDEMKSKCQDTYSDYPVLRFYTASYSKNYSDELHRAEAEEYDEADRRKRAHNKNMRKICAEWKVAGPMANTESFKFRLRQQDEAIAAKENVAAEKNRELQKSIEANVKERIAKENAKENTAIQKKLKEIKDKEASDRAIAKAKSEAAKVEQEAKLERFCRQSGSRGLCECLKYYPKTDSNACGK